MKQNNIQYKVLLGALKIIPMLLAFCEICNTVLCFAGIDCYLLSFIGGVSFLPLLFLYIASYAFKFCKYHRMFLHYILITELLNLYDMYIGIPVDNRQLMAIHCILIGLLLFFVLYYHQKERNVTYHKRLSVKNCCGHRCR